MPLPSNWDRDDVDLLYSLHPHGWSTCSLFVGDITHVCHISHVFGDPIRDAIEATILLLKSNAN